MRKRTEFSAGIPCRENRLREIYKRQFEELAPLRRYIYSQLPIRQVSSVFEPGCGTGLLGKELRALTEALYTGMDVCRELLPEGEMFICGDAEKNPLSADLYISSFFFSSLKNPLKWLKKVRKKLSPGGLFAVFAEYDYTRIEEVPNKGLAAAVRFALEEDGISTTTGGILNSLFEKAGFSKITGGEVLSTLQEPDRTFLEMQTKVASSSGKLPLMSWRIVWGIWRANRHT